MPFTIAVFILVIFFDIFRELNLLPDYANCQSTRDFLAEIYMHILKTLWEQLQQLLANDSPEQLVSKWLQLFRDFWSRVTSRANLISAVYCPPHFHCQLDVMILFYLMNLHFPPEVLRVATLAMRKTQLNQVHPTSALFLFLRISTRDWIPSCHWLLLSALLWITMS